MKWLLLLTILSGYSGSSQSRAEANFELFMSTFCLPYMPQMPQALKRSPFSLLTHSHRIGWTTMARRFRSK